MKTQTKYIAIVASALVVVAVLSFYGGMRYQMHQRIMVGAAGRFGANGAGGRNFGPGVMGGNAQGQARMGMRPVSGEIIAQDDTSITVKMPDGTSRIIILSGETAINTSTAGSKSDLKVGQQVMVFGTPDQNGSITAQSLSVGGMMFGKTNPQSSPSAVKK